MAARAAHAGVVVAGDDDPVMPLANALLLANRLPTGRLLVAPGEGHLLLLDRRAARARDPRLPVSEELAVVAWRKAVEVTRPMLDAACPPECRTRFADERGFRAFWS